MFTRHSAHLPPTHCRLTHQPARWVALLMLIVISTADVARAADAEAIATSEKRLADATRYLAADELEGRGIGTEGLNKAADSSAYSWEKYAPIRSRRLSLSS